ncbi:MAG: hypothetical protein JXR68_11320 [Bacteroidales bacterium]|nr:hypothetical protein [Bacteroidales bacterium]
MQKSDIIEIINGKKNLDSKELEKLKELIIKYPYFETLYNIYIRNSFKISPDLFEKALIQFSVFVNNKRKMVDDIFATQNQIVKKIQPNKTEPKNNGTTEDKTTIDTPTKDKEKEKRIVKNSEKKSKMDEDIFDPVLYERQKIAHKFIVEDFVVEKAQKFGDLRRLLKKENISEEFFWQQLQSEISDEERSNSIIVKDQISEIDNNTEVEKVEEKQKTEDKKENFEKTIKTPETDKTSNSDNKKSTQQSNTTENDDIFSKIAKLKSKKLLDFNANTKKTEENISEIVEGTETIPEKIEENAEIVQENIEENKIVEEKTSEIIDENEIIPEIVEENAEITEIIEEKTSEIIEENEIIPEIIEENAEITEIIEEKTSEIIDENEIIPEIIEENAEITEIIEEKTSEIIEEENHQMSAADKILLKLKSKKNKSFADNSNTGTNKPNVSANDILKKLRGETKEEIIDEVKQTEPLNIIEETKEEIIDEVKETEPLNVIEENNTETKDEVNKKLSAADLILEKIKKRKNEIPKENLIDKFLTEQPYIDRKREPENTEDLSVNSAKETEVATERLAEIYALQGLKEKAISTYEKLILKYPEKNTYFATKIQELKNK